MGSTCYFREKNQRYEKHFYLLAYVTFWIQYIGRGLWIGFLIPVCPDCQTELPERSLVDFG